MKAIKAVYAASLDPITNGHINVIERMAPLYDELIVMIAVDGRKMYTFSTQERVDMAKAAVAHLPNVSVSTCIDHYVVKQAAEIAAKVIVRGLRNFKDLEDEQTLAEENRKICPAIETVWVPCLPHLMHVSSSMVKGHVGIDPDWETQVARSVPAAVVAKLKEKYILDKARKHWASLILSLQNPTQAIKIFNLLVERYAEKHRAYHTLEHIVALLDEQIATGGTDPLISLAIWFHDAVYDPHANDNEEKSAELASLRIKQLELPDLMGSIVSDLIMATKHTEAPKDSGAEYMVDLDLAILGKPEAVFDRYEEDIRKEYDWVAEDVFSATRARILQSFLDRPTIYFTKTFREKYEAQARKNLERSIEKLRTYH